MRAFFAAIAITNAVAVLLTIIFNTSGLYILFGILSLLLVGMGLASRNPNLAIASVCGAIMALCHIFVTPKTTEAFLYVALIANAYMIYECLRELRSNPASEG